MDDINYGWMEAKRKILKQADINIKRYDSKYAKDPIQYKEGDLVRVKQPQTKVGLKKKLRRDLWSQPRTVTKVVSPENVEIDHKKIVNVNNIKKKEPTRANEIIRNTPTITRFGRTSNPRYNISDVRNI